MKAACGVAVSPGEIESSQGNRGWPSVVLQQAACRGVYFPSVSVMMLGSVRFHMLSNRCRAAEKDLCSQSTLKIHR